jgi:hypothetical protein
VVDHSELYVILTQSPGGNVDSDAVKRIDEAVPVAKDPANAVVTDRHSAVRWAGPLFLFCGVVLVPWTLWLAVSLPSRAPAEHYDLAWAGFDAMLLGAIITTAVLTMRRSRYLAIAASLTGGLLVTDAWFDVVTAPDTAERIQAIAAAALAELPLTGLCLWLAVHTEDLNQRRIAILMGWARNDQPTAPRTEA